MQSSLGASPRTILGLIALIVLPSCERRSSASTASTSPAASTAITTTPAPTASAAPAVSAAPTATASAAPALGSAASPGASAGPQAPAAAQCVLLSAPRQLSFTGPMALTFDGAPAGEPPRVIFNVAGAARTARLAPPLASKARVKDDPKARVKADPQARVTDDSPARAELPAPAEDAASPGCALLGRFAYCMDPQGNVRRSLTSGEESVAVATARPGTSIAAAPLGADHTVIAFLAGVRTTEGAVLHAFAKLDDAPPLALSEEGSGATFVTLAPWGDRVLAMYIDERRAMAPMHARILGPSMTPALQMGRDAVVFVGEGGAGRLTGAIATGPDGLGFALVATARDHAVFGMAAVRIEDPPRDDAPTVWSPYPAAMHTAPIAATRGGSAPHALRVRPVSPETKDGRTLELGRIDANGLFHAACPLAEARSFTDLTIEAGADGSLWVAYSSGGKSWIEQRGAPQPTL